MLFILEIGLAIAAWRRGWKRWALLHLGIGFSIGFLADLIISALGASEETVFGVGLTIDTICIGTLIGMVLKPRSVAKRSDTLGQPVQDVEPVDQSSRIELTR
jgi:hypothetical protein